MSKRPARGDLLDRKQAQEREKLTRAFRSLNRKELQRRLRQRPRRTAHMNLRVTPEDKRLCEAAARACRMPLSAYLIACALLGAETLAVKTARSDKPKLSDD